MKKELPWTIRRIYVVVVLVLLCGCATVYNPATQRKEFYFISDSSEISIGKNIARQVIKENHLVDDTTMVERVRRIGERIASVCDRNYLTYNFYVIDEKGINAFSLPGGYVFVNRGAVESLDDNELAFVLAHEIGHVCARHAVKRLQASLGAELVLSLALRDVNNIFIKDATNIIYNLVALGYSRQDEFLADSLAVKYTYRAGYNPEAGIRVMEKLKKDSSEKYTFVFLRSHPPVPERIKNIEEKIAALKGRT